jgi:hypothetical protein
MFHGVTDSTARLEYAVQSGALNESYSDIFGIIISNLKEPDMAKWNWLIGDGLSSGLSAFRDFQDPSRLGHPKLMSEYLHMSQGEDYGGVHYNSGIHNFAAYNIITADDGANGRLFKPGESAAMFYLAAYAFMNLGAFAVVSHLSGKGERYTAVDDFAGLAQRQPLTAAMLTIFISCIGLFGLSVLSAEKRTKEIGIRKVLGASVNNVVTILSKDFVQLVIVALLIATPLAWLAADKWLQNYPYRISLSWQMFAIAGGLVIVVALTTVSFQAIKAAIANPVKSLRTE